MEMRLDISLMGATTAFEIEHIILVSIFGKLASSDISSFPFIE